MIQHDDAIKWKHFSRNWSFGRAIHRSPVNSPHKGQWRGALMLALICVWIIDWVNNRAAGDLRRYRAHYDVIVMSLINRFPLWCGYIILSSILDVDISFRPHLSCGYTDPCGSVLTEPCNWDNCFIDIHLSRYAIPITMFNLFRISWLK